MYNNIFIGTRCGKANTSGNDNIFIGPFAGFLNETGTDNILIGPNAGHDNISNDNMCTIYFNGNPLYMTTAKWKKKRENVGILC